MAKRLAIWLILLFAFFGIANSAYLAQSEINGTPLLCNIQGLSGCNVVAASPYSYLFGYPLAEYGIAFYGLIFVLAALELVLVDRILRRLLQWLGLFGLLASAYFVFIQVEVINAVCVYCTASAILAFLIFVLAWLIEPIREPLRASGSKPMITPPPRPPLTLPPSF